MCYTNKFDFDFDFDFIPQLQNILFAWDLTYKLKHMQAAVMQTQQDQVLVFLPPRQQLHFKVKTGGKTGLYVSVLVAWEHDIRICQSTCLHKAVEKIVLGGHPLITVEYFHCQESEGGEKYL